MGDLFGGPIGSPATPAPYVDPAALARKQAQDAYAANQAKIPGMNTPPQSDFEANAGVNPNGYQGIVDPATGKLLDQYQLNPFTEGSASSRLRDMAESKGPTDYATQLLGKQGFEESQARGNAGLQSQMAQDQAQSALARNGGISSGARTSLARSGARDLLNAGQGVGAQGIQQRYGINANDAQLKQQLLGATAGVEQGTQQQNLSNVLSNMTQQNLYNTNRYNQQMGAWGAQQTADATRAAGSRRGGKK